MALIPMDPEPRPHRYRFIAIYLLCVMLAMIVGAICGLCEAWGWL